MHFSTLLTGLAMMSTTGWARYTLDEDYMADGNFFDKFSFWDAADPTDGFVAYQDQSAAQSSGLVNSTSDNVYLGVDYKSVAPNGRQSVRLTSTSSYQSGLFIVDIAHMPGGICGTWPAFWLVGPDWPNQGEIDIIEGVNDQKTNAMTLHTGPGCSISSNSKFSGSVKTTNCDVNAAGQDQNAGCGIVTNDDQSYGSGFNGNNGGVYATEWTGSSIAIYFFPRNSIPSDITSGSPNPSSWGEPMALFQGGCQFESKFTNQQIVFDTTFCGQWAGTVWPGSTCASQNNGDTCENFVANHPEAFAEAYWSINSLKVYQGGSNGSPAPSSAAPPAPSGSGWGQTTFSKSTVAHSAPPQTSAPAPSGAPPQSSAPAWQPSSAPAASGAPAPSQSVGEVSGQPGWPATQSHHWGGGSPWHSGGWMEHKSGSGAYVVGQPVKDNVEAKETHHAKHLSRHKKHRAGRL